MVVQWLRAYASCSSKGTTNAGSWLHIPPPKLLPEANRSWLLCVGCEEQCGVSWLAEPGDHHATVTAAPTVSNKSAPGNIGCTYCPPPRCATATTTGRARGYMLLHNTRGYCEDNVCGIMGAEAVQCDSECNVTCFTPYKVGRDTGSVLFPYDIIAHGCSRD